MTDAIGIDLGTTYSVMAYLKDGMPAIIPNAEGGHLTPSVVSFDPHFHVFVGDIAKSRAVLDPLGTVSSIKRKMGTSYARKIHGKSYTPVELSSFILQKLKRDAEKFFGCRVNDIVLTVPAYFSDIARQATKHAAEMAGWNVLRIINEPTAATLAYGLGQKNAELVMVCDLGGGTFDVSILGFSKGVYEVLATSGNTELGGDDWTAVISQLLESAFCKAVGNFPIAPQIKQRIWVAAEQAKIQLSNASVAQITLPAVKTSKDHWRSVKVPIHLSEFEGLTKHLCEKLIPHANQTLFDAKIQKCQLHKVILVGGATRMPMVRRIIADFTGRQPFIDLNPDEVVALGAAVQAGIIQGTIEDRVLVDVIPLSLGIETQGGLVNKLIERNSKIPTSKGRIFTTAADHQTEVVVRILQGERELAKHNISLGTVVLEDIPDAPKGVPKVEVTFSIDVDGILNVRALDVYSEHEVGISVQSAIKSAEIDKLLQQAGDHQEEDYEEKERILARIELDAITQAARDLLWETDPMEEKKGSVELARLIELAERKLQSKNNEGFKTLCLQIRETVNALHQRYKKIETKIAA